ncbi:MAG: hypothetical protein PF692_07180 [Kiritimatiellae bacterium]|jgi:uncharacterized membrane protein YbaN (DUF454 family)|nr:hypothetical protein [Kiritimatiellia bacterium]
MFKRLKKKLHNPIYRHHFRITLGIVFMVLGILGCILPILQGILNFSIGIWLLAPYVPFLNRMLARMYSKYPKIYHYHLKVEAKIDKWIDS